MSSKRPRTIGAEFQSQTKFRRGQLPAERTRVAPAFKAYANPSEIAALPQPQLKGGTGVWTALSSPRGGAAEGGRIKQAQLSQLLWAAVGFTKGRERIHLSAHGVSSLETYVLTRNVQDLLAGVYHYDAREHSLAYLETRDATEQLALALLAPIELDAQAAVLCFTGIPRRHKHGDDGRAYRYLYLDAGAAAQDVMVAGSAMGLATNFIADFYDDELTELLQLDGRNEQPLCLVAIGS
ncbi:MAG TPA: SagB/ThcOx family dehydrogenase [Trueperaceae bacterium]|nr:SagB/ThcOx family dehydrogenase [Trueperaceae bacterium]